MLEIPPESYSDTFPFSLFEQFYAFYGFCVEYHGRFLEEDEMSNSVFSANKYLSHLCCIAPKKKSYEHFPQTIIETSADLIPTEGVVLSWCRSFSGFCPFYFFSRLTRKPSDHHAIPCPTAPHRRFLPVFCSFSEIWNARHRGLHSLTTLAPY